MVELLQKATAVVSHGGPGTIVSARQYGHVPIVVPRLKRLREHVDDHQAMFSERLLHLGLIEIAWDAAQLAELIEKRLRGWRATTAATVGIPEGVRRATELLDAWLANEFVGSANRGNSLEQPRN